MEKIIFWFISVILVLSSLAGCSAAGSENVRASEAAYLQSSAISIENPTGATAVYGGDSIKERTAAGREEMFKPYAPYGLTYDAVKDELSYNGTVVRWFEDYYPIGEGAQAGIDFFNEHGAVDVYAVRDLHKAPVSPNGSFDPSGKLVGLKEFSQEAFDARDIAAIKNPKKPTAVSGEEMSVAELKKMLAEYEPFGVTYHLTDEQWFFNGEKVRFFRDVLTSNGESLSGGKFSGSIRMFHGDGTIDIYAVRDYGNVNEDGNGTLTGVQAYSRQE